MHQRHPNRPHQLSSPAPSQTVSHQNGTEDDNNAKGIRRRHRRAHAIINKVTIRWLLVPSVLILCTSIYLFEPIRPFAVTIARVLSSGEAYNIGETLNGFVRSVATTADLAVHDPSTALKAYDRIPLTQNYATILKEYNDFRSTNDVPNYADLDTMQRGLGDTWKVLWLRLYGVETRLTKSFPRTMKLIEDTKLPAVSIMISRLGPRQTLKPHYGPSNAVLRYHLGLRVVKPGPYLAIAQDPKTKPPQFLNWTEGGELYFDDTYLHAAYNPTDHERIVLWLDLKRHDYRGWRVKFWGEILFFAIRMMQPDAIRKTVENTDRYAGEDRS